MREVHPTGGSDAAQVEVDGEVEAPAALIPDSSGDFYAALEARTRAIPRPRPIPIPVPIPFGARFLMWKQDPSVPEPGIRKTFVPSLILSGPLDARISTEMPGTTPVSRNANGDFIFRPGTAEFDCAHTFAVVKHTLTLFERALGGARIPWAWNTGGNLDRLQVFPRAGVTANAFYSRGQRALKFFYFTPSGAPSPVFTCRSLDVVAHEAGHAILDGLKPGWLGIGNPPQTGGLHESFGDLSAIFLALSQLDQIDSFVAITKADLHAKNFLAVLAEEFGAALGRTTGLRNADNDLKLSQVSNEVHDISKVFTGGVYDVLADIYAFEKRRQARTKGPGQVLLEVAQQLLGLVLRAILEAPASGATYADVVNKMLAISLSRGDPVIHRTFIRRRFGFREVVLAPVAVEALMEGRIDLDDPGFVDAEDVAELAAIEHPADKAPQDRSGCCGTMQLPEYTSAAQEAGEAGEPVEDEDLLAEELEELRVEFK